MSDVRRSDVRMGSSRPSICRSTRPAVTRPGLARRSNIRNVQRLDWRELRAQPWAASQYPRQRARHTACRTRPTRYSPPASRWAMVAGPPAFRQAAEKGCLASPVMALGGHATRRPSSAAGQRRLEVVDAEADYCFAPVPLALSVCFFLDRTVGFAPFGYTKFACWIGWSGSATISCTVL